MSVKLYDMVRYPAAVGAERYARMLATAIRPTHERLVAEATGRLLHAAVWAQLSGKPIRLSSFLDDKDTEQLSIMWAADDVSAAVTFLPAAERFLDACAKSPRRIGSEISLELSVCFFSDPEGGQYGYAVPFASHPQLAHVLETLPSVEPYPYWNNTDKPDDVSDDDWAERAAIVERALGNEAFADVSVQFEPPIPSVLFLWLRKQRWFAAAAARGFATAEAERRKAREQSRTPQARESLARWLSSEGRTMTVEDIAASQERDDAELAARFR